MPFRHVRQTELGWSVVQGLRPTKPENAPSIGFSDPLWGFVQRCWGGDIKLRPKVAEVVMRLEREATDWDGLMPPCAPAEDRGLTSEGSMSDSIQHCEFADFFDSSLHCLTEQRCRRNLPVVKYRPRESHRIASYLWAIQPF